MKATRVLLFLICCVFVGIRCANPVMPTGGPSDTTPPKVIANYPESGKTLFADTKLRFTFDEYVQRSSFRQAFRIEPDLGISYNISFSGKSVTIKFDDKLPENTTLIAKVGTQLTDFKNNKLREPIVIAFSTGEKINTGGIKTALRSAIDGSKTETAKLFLFKAESSFSDKAFYAGEADSSGGVLFSYLPEGTYKLIALEDINRNRSVDSFEWAQPSYESVIEVKQDSVVSVKPIYFSKPDTLPPTLEGVGVFASNRIRLRFSEPVFVVKDSTFRVLSDTDTVSFKLLYPEQDDYSVYWALSRKSFSEVKEYSVLAPDVVDAFRNRIDSTRFVFTSDILTDTTQLRIRYVEPKEELLTNESVVIHFNGFVSNLIVDSLRVIEQENQVFPYEYTSVNDAILLIYPKENWDPILSYQFRVYNPATANFFTYSPKIIVPEDLGGIELVRTDSLTYSGQKWIAEIIGDPFYKRMVLESVRIVIPAMKANSVMIRAFQDENGNDKWDSGTIEPYNKPEPFLVIPKINLEKKMTSVVEVTF